MARPSPSCAHDDDRLRLPAASPSRSNSAEKKESTDPRLSQLCPPYVTPSSSSSLEYHRSDARIVENGFAAGSGMSNSAKVGLGRVLIGHSRINSGKHSRPQRHPCKSHKQILTNHFGYPQNLVVGERRHPLVFQSSSEMRALDRLLNFGHLEQPARHTVEVQDFMNIPQFIAGKFRVGC